MKLAELLGKKSPDADVGVEIECEGRRLPAENVKYWHAVHDGSLRDGMEYVFAKPLKASKVSDALDVLHAEFKEHDTKLEFSFRTSVHVHVNCLDLEYVHILNFIYTYMLLENIMVEYCGNSRKANRFCLRLEDADGSIDEIKKLFSYRNNAEMIRMIQRDSIRYASINIEALNKYGTLEFRAMRGTAEKEIILPWVGALMNIKAFATRFNDPKEIYQFVEEAGADAFFDSALGIHADVFRVENLEENIYRNMSLSIDLPFAIIREVEVEEDDGFEYKIGGGYYTKKFLNTHFKGKIPIEYVLAMQEQDKKRKAKKAVLRGIDAFGAVEDRLAPAPRPMNWADLVLDEAAPDREHDEHDEDEIEEEDEDF